MSAEKYRCNVDKKGQKVSSIPRSIFLYESIVDTDIDISKVSSIVSISIFDINNPDYRVDLSTTIRPSFIACLQPYIGHLSQIKNYLKLQWVHYYNISTLVVVCFLLYFCNICNVFYCNYVGLVLWYAGMHLIICVLWDLFTFQSYSRLLSLASGGFAPYPHQRSIPGPHALNKMWIKCIVFVYYLSNTHIIIL